MASFYTHLAIAKLYAERVHIKDLASFYKGSIDPDLTDRKDKTHYGIPPSSFENAWVAVVNKVDLEKFLEHNPLDNDLNLGRFLHLVTDQKFFHEFFGKGFLENLNHETFTSDLFYSYINNNPYLSKKYDLQKIRTYPDLDFESIQAQVNRAFDKIERVKKSHNHLPKSIIDTDKLDAFICEVANLDLQSKHVHVRKS